VEYASYRVRCLLAGDQTVNGFPLADGQLTPLRDGELLDEGTFSAPLQILMVTLAAARGSISSGATAQRSSARGRSDPATASRSFCRETQNSRFGGPPSLAR
jgi:hypothetical protein